MKVVQHPPHFLCWALSGLTEVLHLLRSQNLFMTLQQPKHTDDLMASSLRRSGHLPCFLSEAPLCCRQSKLGSSLWGHPQSWMGKVPILLHWESLDQFILEGEIQMLVTGVSPNL